jgi:hypothetical protein
MLAAIWFETGVNRPILPTPEVSAVKVRPGPAPEPRLNLPAAAYVGDEVCAKCHAEIARTYSRHPMGRSMAKAADVLPDQTGTVLAILGSDYEVERRDGKVFHRATRLSPTGRVIKTEEAEVRYAVGSGARSYAFLVERGDGFYQSPLSWYTGETHWGLSPGYKSLSPPFGRGIPLLCLFCHTNRATMEPGHAPVFPQGLTIGCERCHGPGELHARDPAAATKGGGENLEIINPARLQSRARREEICAQCHMLGFERGLLPGHSPFEYRPGLPLEEFIVLSSRSAKPGLEPPPNGHMDQMRRSRCYRESDGRLGCTSCHDPHRVPEAAERVGYFKDRCLKCHADRGCSLPSADRLARSPADDCASCHMPRASSRELPHIARTDHTIPRKPTSP